MANARITKDEFISLPETQKWGWIFDTLTPMATDYESFQIIKKFGLGLGSLIIGIVGVGSAIMWVINHLR